MQQSDLGALKPCCKLCTQMGWLTKATIACWQFLLSSIKECQIWMWPLSHSHNNENTKQNKSYNNNLIVLNNGLIPAGRNTLLPASDLETFRKQAACLNFPPLAKFHFNTTKGEMAQVFHIDLWVAHLDCPNRAHGHSLMPVSVLMPEHYTLVFLVRIHSQMPKQFRQDVTHTLELAHFQQAVDNCF